LYITVCLLSVLETYTGVWAVMKAWLLALRSFAFSRFLLVKVSSDESRQLASTVMHLLNVFWMELMK